MPGILRAYDPRDTAVDELGEKERKERIEHIRHLWNWRDGKHPDTLKAKLGKRNDNIKFNLCGELIDTIVEFVGVPKLEMADKETSDDPTQGTIDPVQQRLEDILEANDFPTLFQNTLESGNVAGHVFLRLIDGGMGDDIPNMPEVALLDPQTIIAFWDVVQMGRRQEVVFYRLSWEVGKVVKRQDIVPTVLAENRGSDTWTIIEYSSKNGSKYAEDGRDEWPWPFAPIVDWKNRRRPHAFYGQSTLENAAHLNDAVNFIASNTGKIIKHHASPKSVLTGGSLGDLKESSVEGVWEFPSPEAKVTNLEMQSDLQSSMSYLEKLEGRFFTQSRVVDLSGIKDKVGGLTNFGVRVLYSSQVMLSEAIRKQYGTDGMAEVARRLMVMDGVEDARRPVAMFPDPLPVNRKELVEQVATEKEIGLTSDQTLAVDLQRDYQKEQQQKMAEQSNRVDGTTLMLETLGQRGLF